MTTAAWSSSCEQSSDAQFRAWGSELATQLLAIGLVQAADTGQINWTTVTRPAANTDGGYEIFYLNDSMHATAPIYLKFYYGSGTTNARPRVRVEIGTGTNGSGTITGTAKTAVIQLNNSNSSTPGATAQQSYACAVAGHLGIAWKIGDTNHSFLLIVTRTCDGDGTINATGCQVIYSTGVTYGYNQCLRFAATAAAYTAVLQYWTIVPGQVSSSLDASGNNQVYLGWMHTPTVGPNFSAAHVVRTEYGSGTTFSVALVGSSARTFLSVSTNFWPQTNALTGTYGWAFIYE